ncbi:hypothetical protein [Symmachiella dynata]|uniref:hypothetical protein n=1 Tax=Symmachiella dynata TaxID=2527995 RepID=UPI0030ED0D86|tara:strand:+ start:151 stop:693 length:543 start_codon:yes stop_codon:yes gene_type:complete
MVLHYLIQPFRKDMGAAVENLPLRNSMLYYVTTAATIAVINAIYRIITGLTQDEDIMSICKYSSLSLVPVFLLVIIFMHDTVMSVSYKRYLTLMRMLTFIDKKSVTCWSGILTGIIIPALVYVFYHIGGHVINETMKMLNLHFMWFLVPAIALYVYAPICIAIALAGWLLGRLYVKYYPS